MVTKARLPMLRTSERTCFTRCRTKWDWTYTDQLRPKRTSKHLRFGDLVHQSLAAFYMPGRKRGPRPARTYEKLFRELAVEGTMWDEDADDKVSPLELGISVLRNYYETYGDDEDIEIIAPEMAFKVRLIDSGGKPFWYVGRFDALMLWVPNDEYGLLEHKTGSEKLKKNLALDEQAGSYWAFAPMWIKTLIAQGKLRKRGILDLDMVLYNFLRKAMPDQRPTDSDGLRLNKNGTVSKNQPADYFDRVPVYRDEYDRKQVIKRIRQQRYEMRLVQAGKLPVYKHPTSDCSWDCSFYDMCELHETGSDWQAFRDQMFTTGDGYEEYRKDLLDVTKGA